MKITKGNIFFVAFFLFLFFLISFLDMLSGPLIVSFILAYLLNPISDFFCKNGIKRSYTAIFFVTLISVLFLVLIRAFVPLFIEQVESLLILSPHLKEDLNHSVISRFADVLNQLTGKSYDVKRLGIYDAFALNLKNLEDAVLLGIGSSTKYVASRAIVVLISPFFLFFLMRDLPRIYGYVFSLVPQQVKPIFQRFITEVNSKLTRVLRGQFLVILILCVLYPSALALAGLPSAIAVGVIIALARLIPYFDLVTGVTLISFVLLTNSADNALILWVFVAFFTVQCLDGLFITPRIMGRFSGLHPFVVILAVICFGNWFGFWGVLLAIPSAAILKVAFTMMINTYRESDFFKDGFSR